MKLFNFLRETFADALGLLRSPEGLKSLYGVSLYRNAVYLRLTSGATAVLGFAFWVVVARLYSTSDIGLSFALGHCRTIDSPRIPGVELRAKRFLNLGRRRWNEKT